MKRLLITGGAGFIGSNFCRYWSETHAADRVVVLDALTYAGNRANLTELIRDGRVRLVHGDIGDLEHTRALLRDERIDTIVNFAAETHVDRSIDDPSVFVRTNVLGTQMLLEAARSAWGASAGERGCRFHHVSTDEVFGSLAPHEPPCTEESRYAPNSPYAASKAAADHLVRAYANTFGVPATVSLCSNNYGPRQFPEKLLPLCLINILEGRRLPIYGDGLQLRNWLHVDDHCRAIDLILRHSPAGRAWNVGGPAEQSNIATVVQLCDIVDALFAADPELASRFPMAPAARGTSSRTLIAHVPDRPGHDRRYALDCGQIERTLAFTRTTTLSAGMAMTARWYIDHERWWRKAALATASSGLPPVRCEVPYRDSAVSRNVPS